MTQQPDQRPAVPASTTATRDHEVATISDQMSAAGTDGIWPGGWYVYEDGRVDGPMSAATAFSMTAKTTEGKPRLVSRKGFTQWYALGDLAEIFKLTDRMGQLRHETQAQVKSETDEHHSASSHRTDSHLVPPPPAKPRIPTIAIQSPFERTASSEAVHPDAPRLDLHTSGHRDLASLQATQPTSTRVAKPDRPDKTSSMVRPFSEPEPKSLRTREPSGFHETNYSFTRAEADLDDQPASSIQVVHVSKHEVMTELFLQRGRMRLGKVRQAWLAGFVGLPLTLGVYWYLWFRDLAAEMAFHMQEPKSNMPSPVLALVPGVHIYMVYRLALTLQRLEEQNKYRSVSPVLAAVFAVIPPFALTYLQDAANRHWLMHAKHAAVKRHKS